jgi:hypothetical protein
MGHPGTQLVGTQHVLMPPRGFGAWPNVSKASLGATCRLAMGRRGRHHLVLVCPQQQKVQLLLQQASRLLLYSNHSWSYLQHASTTQHLYHATLIPAFVGAFHLGPTHHTPTALSGCSCQPHMPPPRGVRSSLIAMLLLLAI